MARITEALGRTEMFGPLGGEDLRILAADSRVRSIQRGDVLFRRGEPAEALFLVEAGRLRLARSTAEGAEHVVEVIREGELFAVLPVLERGTYPVTAIAEEDVRVVSVPARAFHRCLRNDPGLHARAARSIGRRLRSLNSRLEELATRPVPERIARHLLRLAEAAGGAVAGVEVDLGAKREVVARQLGMAREVLIRHLRRWQDEETVSLNRRRVVIRDLDALRRLAGTEPSGTWPLPV